MSAADPLTKILLVESWINARLQAERKRGLLCAPRGRGDREMICRKLRLEAR